MAQESCSEAVFRLTAHVLSWHHLPRFNLSCCPFFMLYLFGMPFGQCAGHISLSLGCQVALLATRGRGLYNYRLHLSFHVICVPSTVLALRGRNGHAHHDDDHQFILHICSILAYTAHGYRLVPRTILSKGSTDFGILRKFVKTAKSKVCSDKLTHWLRPSRAMKSEAFE